MVYSKNKLSQIRKRSGKIVTFDQEKITQAIWKAMQAIGENEEKDKKRAVKYSDQTAAILNKRFHYRSIPAIEEIQDIVEEVLIRSREIGAAKAYILYRDQRRKVRELQLMVNSDDLMRSYLDQLDWRVKENSNMAYSLQGLNNHVTSAVSSHYWLNKIYPQEVREAHTDGDLHIHDLSSMSSYCCGWDLKDLLMMGFGGVEGKIESKPAKHFHSALGQIVNFFYTMQGEVAGAQALSNFDTYLAPFIRYDQLSYDEVKQVIQTFLFNISVPTRVGFQTPFVNISLDVDVPSNIREDAVIMGGKPQKEKYGDFQKEMDIFNQALGEMMAKGDATGRVFTFPIPTYNITKNFDWKRKALEPMWEMTAKYGIPYFANYVNSDMKPEDARSMCCRLRLDNRELRKRGGGLFAANPLTGSIGVVTLNMPRLGYLSKTRQEFFDRLSRLMEIAKKSLEIKREMLEKFTNQGLYPYCKYYLNGIHQRFEEYWRNHFNTIGLVGMNEACLNFMGRSIATAEGREFSQAVLDFMRERLMDYQLETNNLYNLEATPAEGVSLRLPRLDKKKFPDIITANEKDYQEKGVTPYYTNSTHLPVGYTEDVFEALKLQDSLQTKYTGGTVLHGFLGERLTRGEEAKTLVKKVTDNFSLPYFSVTPTFSICRKDGYLSGDHALCPKCGEKTEVYSRIVGYLRPLIQWHDAKRAEYADRKEYVFKE